MHKQQRNSPLHFAPLPHEMNIQLPKPVHLDARRELRGALRPIETPIQFLLCKPPIPRLPRLHQALHLLQRNAHVPLRIGKLVRELGEGKFSFEGIDLGLGD